MSLSAPSGERLYNTRELAGYDKQQLEDRARHPRSYRILGSSVTPTEVLENRVGLFEQLPPLVDQWDVINVQKSVMTEYLLLAHRDRAERRIADVSSRTPAYIRGDELGRVLTARDSIDGRIEAARNERVMFIEAAHEKYNKYGFETKGKE